ncbi:helix-turn-helix domain-containing protein [Ferruginibacter sp. SUN106]|uniref:helix-turn-helix domain-containing protein n=1 Tax=Ferruginibacter sp. SUN106 TaxID=2978348 RepID=UPI003D36C30F
MTEPNLQKELFAYIKEGLPAHISLVDTLAELLDISYDSVYRRLRGEKPITLDELKLLCEKFNLSLDQVLQLRSNKILFTDPEADNDVKDFKEYLGGLLQVFEQFKQAKQKEMLYLSKDVPFFHFFYFKELAAFKAFFWDKSILNNPVYDGKTFSIKNYDVSESFAMGQKILQGYNEMPSSELWNYESINSTILQIEYYRDAGIFDTKEDLALVVDSCDAMLQHLQKQAEKGIKFLPGAGEAGYKASLKLYINEIILGNNSIMVELDGHRISFINYIVLKYISTMDKKFTEKTFDNFNNLVSRSVMISGTGEKERVKFFKTLRDRVQACKK